MRISRKLLLSHVIIITFILMETFTHQRITNNVSRELALLGNQTVETVSLLKDLRFTGLRIITSTGEFLLIASLQDQGGAETGPGHADELSQVEKERRESHEDGHGEGREKAHGEAHKEGHGEGHEEGHMNPDAARLHVEQVIGRYEEKMQLFEQHISAKPTNNQVFSSDVKTAGEALIAKSRSLLKTASHGFNSGEVLEQREEFEGLERVFLGAIEAALENQQTKHASEQNTVFAGISKVSNAGWLGFLVISAFILIFGGFVTNAISRPTKALADGVKAVATGQLSVRLDMHRSDEIGEVAAGFDNMVETLQEKDTILNQRISDLNDTRDRLAKLNAKLEDRTAQLTVSFRSEMRWFRMVSFSCSVSTILSNPAATSPISSDLCISSRTES